MDLDIVKSVINTIEHMFFDCTATKEVRELNWYKVIEMCPKQLVREMEAKSKRELCMFISLTIIMVKLLVSTDFVQIL